MNTTIDYEKQYREAVRVIQLTEQAATILRDSLKHYGRGWDTSTATSIIIDCAAFLDCHEEGHLT